MMTLNLPPDDLRLSQRNGQTMVFDFLRRRYIKLTPEEWVRQHFVHYLVHHKGDPQELLANEVSLVLNTTSKRCDTVLYDKEARPLAIMEYKAPSIQLTQKTFDQISRYNIVMRVPFLMVSNGLQHYCCRVDYETNVCTFLPEIPSYDEIAH